MQNIVEKLTEALVALEEIKARGVLQNDSVDIFAKNLENALKAALTEAQVSEEKSVGADEITSIVASIDEQIHKLIQLTEKIDPTPMGEMVPANDRVTGS